MLPHVTAQYARNVQNDPSTIKKLLQPKDTKAIAITPAINKNIVELI